jgi:hypothetical protein
LEKILSFSEILRDVPGSSMLIVVIVERPCTMAKLMKTAFVVVIMDGRSMSKAVVQVNPVNQMEDEVSIKFVNLGIH